MQGCSKGQKSGGAGSNAARRRCPAAPSDLPESGGHLAASLIFRERGLQPMAASSHVLYILQPSLHQVHSLLRLDYVVQICTKNYTSESICIVLVDKWRQKNPLIR